MAPRTKSKLDVDAEYTKAFSSKSFVDIWAKAHLHPKAATSPTRPEPDAIAGGQQSSPLLYGSYTQLPDFLLDPSQASLLASAAASSSGFGGDGSSLLLDYLDATLQSFTSCASLLASIDRILSLHRAIHFLFLRLASATGVSCTAELAKYIDLDNPLSPLSLAHFHRMHALYPPLVRRLTEERRRLGWREHAICGARTAPGMAGIAALGTVSVVEAVVAAAPLVFSGGRRRWRRWVNLGWPEKAGRTVDAAARGAYTVGRELDTVSRMVRRVHDEVEHGRDVARMVLRSPETVLLAREAVREMQFGEACFQEQLEELKEHVYLCLLTINHSRCLFAQELAVN